MKGTPLALLSALLATPLLQCAAEQLIPAGSLIQCTVAEPKISSKTTAIGDPVLCQTGHAERYGRSVLPLNSYLVGRFEDYKDPGHFVGKGWMELRFDRMVIEPNTIIPVDAKVVAVPGYNVDRDGRILGKGHLTRDIVLWSIPVLWPIDLLMMPARGPRPTLKEETRLTLKVMDDLGIPDVAPPPRDPYGLIERQPSAEAAPPPPYADAPQAEAEAEAAPMDEPARAPAPAPVYAYAAPPPVVYGYGGVGVGVGVYGAYARRGDARSPSPYGYGGPSRGYANSGAPRANAYRPAPHGYGYGAAPRAYGYGQARMGAGYGAGRGAGMARGGAGHMGR